MHEDANRGRDAKHDGSPYRTGRAVPAQNAEYARQGRRVLLGHAHQRPSANVNSIQDSVALP